jgi:hypothetical protein
VASEEGGIRVVQPVRLSDFITVQVQVRVGCACMLRGGKGVATINTL